MGFINQQTSLGGPTLYGKISPGLVADSTPLAPRAHDPDQFRRILGSKYQVTGGDLFLEDPHKNGIQKCMVYK